MYQRVVLYNTEPHKTEWVFFVIFLGNVSYSKKSILIGHVKQHTGSMAVEQTL